MRQLQGVPVRRASNGAGVAVDVLGAGARAGVRQARVERVDATAASRVVGVEAWRRPGPACRSPRRRRGPRRRNRLSSVDVRDVVVVLVVRAVAHAVAVGVGVGRARAGVADAVRLLDRVARGPVARRSCARASRRSSEAVGVLVALVVGQVAVAVDVVVVELASVSPCRRGRRRTGRSVLPAIEAVPSSSRRRGPAGQTCAVAGGAGPVDEAASCLS